MAKLRMRMDTLLSTAPRGAFFLETEHTARFFREESWIPAFMDHRVPLAWAANPSDMIERARSRARDLFANARNRCPLSEGQRREIRKLVKEADAAASRET
ncbi:MAG: hypothetical protein KAJ81_09325 [Candidatus Latescibacteria bacterium]|nr:hypothetical protein [Candidatus Latescibacterota bacterium]